ncbi:MAG: GxxExxY protein [Candidatus Omnitrophota bacterium]|nr:GxxExxY protein [Candidatus Omnitrophota bacterium]MBU1928490.1 GxxExxY protein [Candidatus Omnitrophota bacterium]MBU2035437.1 GxxExxY protein [Candidatus Omnitrophota bacterium]MBU2221319.1 GxxExxY protein [Candidatus Omnitrophota bacterium]MBU2257952.1 GxxExxY protein [Candidatus Omnitrophota bacterium]
MITEIKNQIPEIKDRDPLTERIIACAYRVHSELGPGFIEKIYHNALRIALKEEGLKYDTEKEFKVIYQSKQAGFFRVDLIVENKVIIEVKAVTGNMPLVFEAQVLSYLKVTCHKVGLLINFGNKSCQVRRLMF